MLVEPPPDGTLALQGTPAKTQGLNADIFVKVGPVDTSLDAHEPIFAISGRAVLEAVIGGERGRDGLPIVQFDGDTGAPVHERRGDDVWRPHFMS